MTIPQGAKPLILRDYETAALAAGRLGAIVRVVKPQPTWFDCGVDGTQRWKG